MPVTNPCFLQSTLDGRTKSEGGTNVVDAFLVLKCCLYPLTVLTNSSCSCKNKHKLNSLLNGCQENVTNMQGKCKYLDQWVLDDIQICRNSDNKSIHNKKFISLF